MNGIKKSQLSSNGSASRQQFLFILLLTGISGQSFHDAGFSAKEAICGKQSLQRGQRQVQFFNS